MARKKSERKKKIAIFGTTPSRMSGPVEEPDWEKWTIGPGGKDTLAWDRLFEMHGTWPADFNGYLNDLSLVESPQEVWTLRPMPEAIRTWARKHAGIEPEIPAYIAEWVEKNSADAAKAMEEIKVAGNGGGNTEQSLLASIKGDWKSNRIYPKEDILEKYQRRMWFSSSIAWLIPLAIEEEPSDIGFWGIDLESGEEYISQFVGCAHLIDMARFMGINIHLPSGCGLLRDPAPYPDRYETQLALTLEKKRKWIGEMIADVDPKLETLKMEVYRQEGLCISLKARGVPEEELTAAEARLVGLNGHLGNAIAHINQLRGELGATEFYYKQFVVGLQDPDSFHV